MVLGPSSSSTEMPAQVSAWSGLRAAPTLTGRKPHRRHRGRVASTASADSRKGKLRRNPLRLVGDHMLVRAFLSQGHDRFVVVRMVPGL